VGFDSFEHHLLSPQGCGRLPRGGEVGVAGGAACGDEIRFGIALHGGRVAAAGFEASGCGTMIAAGSAAVTLMQGRPLLEAARVGAGALDAELGGLIPGKRHAVELAADALHRALGAAARRASPLAQRGGRTLVALSGGVDSTVAALLLGRAGGEVAAVTLELWADDGHDGSRSCCSAQAVRGARDVAHGLGLPHLTLDLRAEFRAGVVDPWLEGHAAGETPNPCVRCNGQVRLDAMIDLAERLGAEALATGHYARIADDGGGPLLRLAADAAKDQSYMLCALAPESLARLRFPLGELTKPRVRELAAEAGLAVASRRDSQDLCFLAGTGRDAFLARHGRLRSQEGEIVDADGRRLGRHRGHHRFTVGQRRGLGVAARDPLYVLATDARANRVVVGPRAGLRLQRVRVREAVLHRPAARVDGAKLRYRSAPVGARAVGAAPDLELALSEPVLGAAPGQTACLLDGELVVGSGTIAPSRS
jgi:tRNA-uridine 2-sulfurtransferase